MFDPCFFYVVFSSLSNFVLILMEKRERAGYFLVSCDRLYYVALPHGAGCVSLQLFLVVYSDHTH